jgi:two-component system, sporulation sensor kinase B
MVLDRRSMHNRFMSVFIYIGALSCLADSISPFFVPWLKEHYQITDETAWMLFSVEGGVSRFCEHAMIYLFLVYCVLYSTIFSKKIEKIHMGLGFFVGFVMMVSMPLLGIYQTTQNGMNQQYYMILSVWALPMILYSLILLVISYRKTRNPDHKRQRMINMLIILPIAISISINLILLRAFGMMPPVLLNYTVVTVFSLVLVGFVIKSGALGIRIRFERQDTLSRIDSVATGTSEFNHTLKNEVSKISLSIQNVKKLVSFISDSEDLYDSIQVIENSSSFLGKVIQRLKVFSDQIMIEPTTLSLSLIIAESIKNVQPLLDRGKVSIETNMALDAMIRCDKLHFIGCISNILKNSCEALEEKKTGHIQLDVTTDTKQIYLAIKDNGPGIPKSQLGQVFDPFYTTKGSSKLNFGIGLSYCYRVLEKHQCSIQIFSKQDIETIVTITIPYHIVEK